MYASLALQQQQLAEGNKENRELVRQAISILCREVGKPPVGLNGTTTTTGCRPQTPVTRSIMWVLFAVLLVFIVYRNVVGRLAVLGLWVVTIGVGAGIGPSYT